MNVCLSAKWLAAFLLPLQLAVAQEITAADWLHKMGEAIATNSYRGNYIFQRGSEMEFSEIIHKHDDKGVLWERYEIQNGSPKVIERMGGRVICYVHKQKLRIISRNDLTALQGEAPEFSSIDLKHVQENYEIKLEGVAHLANRQVQIINLMPRDSYRYARQMWLDVDTGLPLRSRLINDNGATIEQMAFTQIEWNPQVSVSSGEDPLPPDWLNYELIERDIAKMPNVVWQIDRPPPGFYLIKEFWVVSNKSADRLRPAGGRDFAHYVYSDGATRISLFIRGGELQNLASYQKGYARNLNGYHVVVLGDAPRITLQDLGDAVRLIDK